MSAVRNVILVEETGHVPPFVEVGNFRLPVAGPGTVGLDFAYNVYEIYVAMFNAELEQRNCRPATIACPCGTGVLA